MLENDRKKLLEKGCCTFVIDNEEDLATLEEFSKNRAFDSKEWIHLRWSSHLLHFRNNKQAMKFVNYHKPGHSMQYLDQENVPNQAYFESDVREKADTRENIEKVRNLFRKFTCEGYNLKREDLDPHVDFRVNVHVNGFHIRNHRDGQNYGEGQNSRICAILIYMNKDWKKEHGGNLIIHNGEETITPSFGRVVMIDLTKHDIEHAVDRIIIDKPRLSLIVFMTPNFYE